MDSQPATSSFPSARKRVSADASRAVELARLRAMSVEERIREALSLKRKLALNPQPKS